MPIINKTRVFSQNRGCWEVRSRYRMLQRHTVVTSVRRSFSPLSSYWLYVRTIKLVLLFTSWVSQSLLFHTLSPHLLGHYNWISLLHIPPQTSCCLKQFLPMSSITFTLSLVCYPFVKRNQVCLYPLWYSIPLSALCTTYSVLGRMISASPVHLQNWSPSSLESLQ